MPLPHMPMERLEADGAVASYNAQGQASRDGRPVPRAECVPLHLCSRVRPQLTPDAGVMALRIEEEARRRGWDVRFTEIDRPVRVQARARRRYEDEGGPYTARPMTSAHGAGRAFDLYVGPLSRGGPSYLEFRDWMEARGWTTVVGRLRKGRPRQWGHSETWHWQFDGPWAPVRARLGYAQAMFAATLDVGRWAWLVQDARENPQSPWTGWDGERVCHALVQAQLQRAGFDCGHIDGLPGRRTEGAAAAAGLDLGGAPADVARRAYNLPSSTRLRWGPSLRGAA